MTEWEKVKARKKRIGLKEKYGKDLTGIRFGKLLVIEKPTKEEIENAGKKGKYSWYWKCKCDCGKIVFVDRHCLVTGNTYSCGCSRIGQTSANKKDIAGKRFGKLVAIRPATKVEEDNQLRNANYRKTYWLCKCDCGNEKLIQTQQLTKGKTQSCGCIKSYGEERIAKILQEHKIPFERQYKLLLNKTKQWLRTDFFVNNKYVIEYDGKQHFDINFNFGNKKYAIEQIKRDKIKDRYCKKQNIPMIRIPYTHYKELSIKDLLLDTSRFII